MEYKRYPLVMRHPSNRKPVIHREQDQQYTQGSLPGGGSGEPERFPDITVQNADQEEYYKAQGYLPPDAPQAGRAIGFQEYPRWVYHAVEDAIIVNDEAAFKALPVGWFPTQGEADAYFKAARTGTASVVPPAPLGNAPAPSKKKNKKAKTKSHSTRSKVERQVTPSPTESARRAKISRTMARKQAEKRAAAAAAAQG